jgi:hypothetical protein
MKKLVLIYLLSLFFLATNYTVTAQVDAESNKPIDKNATKETKALYGTTDRWARCSSAT